LIELQFKLCTLVYVIHDGQCPTYFSDARQSVASRHEKDYDLLLLISYVTARVQT